MKLLLLNPNTTEDITDMIAEAADLAAADDTECVVRTAPWGLPYIAWASGADILQPEKFLQPEPVAAMIASERPTMSAAVPTVWNGLNACSAKQKNKNRTNHCSPTIKHAWPKNEVKTSWRYGNSRNTLSRGRGMPAARPTGSCKSCCLYRKTKVTIGGHDSKNSIKPIRAPCWPVFLPNITSSRAIRRGP